MSDRLHHALLLLVIGAVTVSTQEPEVDTFKFRDGASRALSVTLEQAGTGTVMEWPASAGDDWDSAFLGVRVDVDFQGPAPRTTAVKPSESPVASWRRPQRSASLRESMTGGGSRA